MYTFLSSLADNLIVLLFLFVKEFQGKSKGHKTHPLLNLYCNDLRLYLRFVCTKEMMSTYFS